MHSWSLKLGFGQVVESGLHCRDGLMQTYDLQVQGRACACGVLLHIARHHRLLLGGCWMMSGAAMSVTSYMFRTACDDIAVLFMDLGSYTPTPVSGMLGSSGGRTAVGEYALRTRSHSLLAGSQDS